MWRSSTPPRHPVPPIESAVVLLLNFQIRSSDKDPLSFVSHSNFGASKAPSSRNFLHRQHCKKTAVFGPPQPASAMAGNVRSASPLLVLVVLLVAFTLCPVDASGARRELKQTTSVNATSSSATDGDCAMPSTTYLYATRYVKPDC